MNKQNIFLLVVLDDVDWRRHQQVHGRESWDSFISPSLNRFSRIVLPTANIRFDIEESRWNALRKTWTRRRLRRREWISSRLRRRVLSITIAAFLIGKAFVTQLVKRLSPFLIAFSPLRFTVGWQLKITKRQFQLLFLLWYNLHHVLLITTQRFVEQVVDRLSILLIYFQSFVTWKRICYSVDLLSEAQSQLGMMLLPLTFWHFKGEKRKKDLEWIQTTRINHDRMYHHLIGTKWVA